MSLRSAVTEGAILAATPAGAWPASSKLSRHPGAPPVRRLRARRSLPTSLRRIATPSRAWRLIARTAGSPKVGIFALLLLLAAGGVAEAGGDLLEGEFWTQLTPYDPESGAPEPRDEDRAIRRILEEARQVFSGMVYGYRFRYVPDRRGHGVTPVFELDPIAEIAWGDERMRVAQGREAEGRVYAVVRYRLRDFQQARYEAWQSRRLSPSTGTGQVRTAEGADAKLDALREALREAIRNRARTEYAAQPRELRGRLALTEVPRTTVRGGNYRTRASIRVVFTKAEYYE